MDDHEPLPKPPADGSGERAGTQIGPYRLVEPLGEGGMGTVWLAEQTEPIRRRVALKVIKVGLDTAQVVARFEAERQALALMDHPGIARVIDAGSTAAGRPYFVMERVDGAPITAYCERAGLDLEARLELFALVCDAVQHAHQKGVIHRDLKPSNVLVAEVDGRPAPKVIDFGIAKATAGGPAERTLLTQGLQILGTPDYMAPEQASFDGEGVDTRADVYALGVMLYELVTGTRPLDAAGLAESGIDELLRAIRERTPPRPSTRVATLVREATAAGAPAPSIDPSAVRRLRGDLDWVVMKALEKERDRRYDSAGAFAADVRRHLAGHAVEAAPPSRVYRLSKFVRRNRVGVGLAGVAGLAIVLGALGSGVGYWRTLRANERLDRAIESEARRADELERVADFQGRLLEGFDVRTIGEGLRAELLALAGEERDPAFDATLERVNFTSLALANLESSLFTRMVDAIEREFAGDPQVQARLYSSTGRILRHLGLLEAALVPFERCIALWTEVLGPDHPDTLGAIAMRASVSERLRDLPTAVEGFEAALAGLERAGIHDPGLDAFVRSHLSQAYSELGRADDALALVAPLVTSEAELDVNGMFALAGYATALQAKGELERALPVRERLVDVAANPFGPDARNVVSMRAELANLLGMLGRSAEALAIFEQAHAELARLRGDDFLETLILDTQVARYLAEVGRAEESRARYGAVLARAVAAHGVDHAMAIAARTGLANRDFADGRYAEAAESYAALAELRARTLGPAHATALEARSNQAQALALLGEHERALALLTEALAALDASGGDEPLTRVELLRELGREQLALGRSAEAEASLAAASDLARGLVGSEHPLALAVDQARFELLERTGRADAALALLGEITAACERRFGPADPQTLGLRAARVAFLVRQDRTVEGRTAVDGLRAAVEASLGADHALVGEVRALEAQLGGD